MIGPHDSPTFLASKDKLLLGMTMGQVGLFMLSAIMWFMVAFSLDMPMKMRLLTFGPAHVLTVVIGTVRVGGGMFIPIYVLLMLRSLVTTPLYHATGGEVRGGLPEWLQQEMQQDPVFGQGAAAVEPARSGLSGKFVSSMRLFRKGVLKQSDSKEARAARAIATVEAEQRASDAAHGAKSFVRQMVKILTGKSA